LHLRLLLTSLEVMIKLNHKLSKNVDIKMIGQCEKMQACNSCSSISLIKAQFVVQDFSQRLNIDCEETYSPVMDAITFKFFIDLVVVLMIN